MRNYSRIPLRGLPHLFNVVRRADSDDGAGGVISGGTSTTIYADAKGRVTTLGGEDEQKIFGNFSGKRWSFTLEYSEDIEKSDFIEVSSNSRTAPLAVGVECRILYVKHQIDDFGRFHHTLLFAEEE